MNERYFWWLLQVRVSDELAEMEDRSLRPFWCDGFTPTTYTIDGPVPRITGTASIFKGRKPEVWVFTLFLPRPVAFPDAIDWPTLLPAENATNWLGPDTERRTLNIHPSAVMPSG
jgi:hypothetical protein